MPNVACPRTVDLGLYRDISGYKREIELKGISLEESFEWIYNCIQVIDRRKTVGIAVHSLRELGFDKPASVKEIHDAGMNLGYSLCPPELSLALRLTFLDQPIFQYLTLAMEPIIDKEGRAWCIAVVHNTFKKDDHKWVVCEVKSVMRHPRLSLRCYPGCLTDIYHQDMVFLFVGASE